MEKNELFCPGPRVKLGCLVYLLSWGLFPSSYATARDRRRTDSNRSLDLDH